MIKVTVDFEKVNKSLNVVNTVSHTVKSDSHVKDLMKAANVLLTSEFIMHMSRAAVAAPKMYGHMYDWGGIGDPGARLWKHNLRGRGDVRELTFDFKASKRTVPVAPALAAVGVKRRHIFYWKAPVMELGLPVRISPVIAKMLVFEEKNVKNPSSSIGEGYARSGIVYYRGTINIDRQGSQMHWGSFTQEFLRWFGSNQPDQILRDNLESKIKNTIRTTVNAALRTPTRVSTKTITMQPVGLDAGFQKTLDESLRKDYSKSIATRRLMSDE